MRTIRAIAFGRGRCYCGGQLLLFFEALAYRLFELLSTSGLERLSGECCGVTGGCQRKALVGRRWWMGAGSRRWVGGWLGGGTEV